MKYKTFDFEEALKQKRNIARLAWYKLNQYNPISEEEYIKIMRQIKSYTTSNYKFKNYKPSRLKKEYKNLKKDFGFFK